MKLQIGLSLLPAVLLFTTFMIVPIGIMIVTSFYQWNAFGLEWLGLDNYQRLFTQDRAASSALINTAIWIGAACFLHVPMGLAVAVILSKKLRGWRIFRTLFFIPNIISYASLSIVYLSFFNARYGLLNSMLEGAGFEGLTRDWLFTTDTALAAIIMTWLFQIGLYMLLFMAEIAAIPEQLYEAAEIDGASEFQKDLLITIPLLRNIIGTAMILAATRSLIYFEGILLMTEGGPANATLNLPMFAYRNYSNFNWGYTNAIGVLILIIGIVLIVSIRQLFNVGRRDLA